MEGLSFFTHPVETIYIQGCILFPILEFIPRKYAYLPHLGLANTMSLCRKIIKCAFVFIKITVDYRYVIIKNKIYVSIKYFNQHSSIDKNL